MYTWLEALENDDKRILERFRYWMAEDVVMTAPPLAAKGVFMWEIAGVENIISEFGRLFFDEHLAPLPGSKVR